MLSIGKLGAGQETYYLEKVAQGAEDYYSGEGEAEGRWKGEGARELGLEREVRAEQLTAMLTGRDPASGDLLVGVRGVSGGRGPVPGFDLTFSSPKSVSLLWALGNPSTSAAVRQAHERSVDAALAYLERQACWARRGKGGAEFVKGNGYLAAAFRHRSSRAGDPQLHTHVLIANATKGPDGRWTRLYHPAIYEHAKTAGCLYEAQLRHELSRDLGLDWQQVRNGIAEIAGFTDEQLREFSQRRAEILAAAGGPDASRAARQAATLATRAAKDYDVSPQTMRERWQERAAEVGLDQAALHHILEPDLDLGLSAGGRPVLTAEQLDRAVTARASHFDRRGAVQAVAESLRKGAPASEVEELADAFLASEQVIVIGEGPKGERFTTARIWALEHEALATAERLRAEPRAVAEEAIASHVLASHPTLKKDQRQMVERLLAGEEGISIVIGEAGAGKTYAIAAAAHGWARAGIPLLAAAPTWQAANVLGAEGVPATSVARLLAELDDPTGPSGRGLPADSVLLIDEAAMVDSATLARLIGHADQAGAKLVLVGDPAQLPELEAGGLFSALAERGEPIQLTEVIRHNHELDREAAKLIRSGHGVEALELYRSEERVTVAPDAESKRAAIVGDWWESYSRGEDALILSQRNVEVERLNQLARRVLREQGQLGEAEIEVAGKPFAVGDQVVTRVNCRAHDVHNRERWRVAALEAEEGQLKLESLDGTRQVILDADYLARTTQRGAPALQHAYASNLYLAQGATVDTAFVAAEPSMDQADFYVAMSRARGETRLYAVAEPELARDEIAPRQPFERELLDEVRDAIERQGAQVAAVDEAMRVALAKLPTSELVERRELLAAQVSAETFGPASERRAGERPDRLAPLEANALEPPPSPPLQEPGAELAMVERVLEERRGLAITAARVSPPDYLITALGEKPSDPADLVVWERGLREVEGYRQIHGVSDRRHALGREQEPGFEQPAYRRSAERIASLQRHLGLERGRQHLVEQALEIEL